MKKISTSLFLILFTYQIAFSQICPQTGNLVIPASGQSSSTLNPVYNGGVVVINGDLTVDDALTFDNCTVYIAEDVRIVVEDNPNAKLKIIDSELFSCGSDMWMGIYVKAQGSLDMQGSTLEDAQWGVHTRNSSGLVTLLDNTFNKNHIHILAETANAANIYIYGNDFFCHDMGNTFSTNGDFLEAPFLNQQTEIAIEGQSNTNVLTIGNPGFDVNNFFECKFGLKLVNCDAVVQNNHFENIGTSYLAPQNQPYPYETPFTAILAFDFFGTKTMEIGGGGINEQNTINRCIHGFEINDYRTVNINFNHFTNDMPNPGNFQAGPGNTAITVNIVDHAGITNVNITNNEIRHFDFGIIYYFRDQTIINNDVVNISENTVDRTNILKGRTGIITKGNMTNSTLSGVNDFYIFRNRIWDLNMGIHTYNTSGRFANLEANTIYITYLTAQSTSFGIKDENNSFPYFHKNKISSTGTTLAHKPFIWTL